jgi:hypothetical protein
LQLRFCSVTRIIVWIMPIWYAASRRTRRAGRPSRRRWLADGGYLVVAAPADLSGTSSWRPELVPVTLLVEPAPEEFKAHSIDPQTLGVLLADQTCPEGRHIVIADEDGEHRLWGRGAKTGQPSAVLVPLDRDFETRIASLLRFHRYLLGKPSGSPPRGWVLTPYRRARLHHMLCALDMHLAGTSYRDIAKKLGESDAAAFPATESKDSRGRSRIIRLVTGAKALMNGGYRKLLGGR